MEHRWVVLKFGGTSVATAERWQTIATEVERRLAEGLRPLIVCSALSGISNLLEELLQLAIEGRHEAAVAALRGRHLELGAALGIDAAGVLAPDFEEISRLALAASLLREAGPALKARVMAFGELMSTRIGAAWLHARGLRVAWHDARSSLVAREEGGGARAFLAATCDAEPDEELRRRLGGLPAAVVVTQGFIARNREGQTVLLGRGGSDTSASYFAARLKAERCEIWTDVPGLFTADPTLVSSARLLRALDYDEAQEIAAMGAKVLHPRTVAPLRRGRIPLHIRWTERPDFTGTVVSSAGPEVGPQVKAISSRSRLPLLSLETVGMWQEVGFMAEVSTAFARHGLSIDSVATSGTNVTVSLDPGANSLDPQVLDALVRDLQRLCEVRVFPATASISLVGRGIRTILHEIGPLFEAFEELDVYLMTQAASDLNLTFFVDEGESARLVGQLHALLFGHRGETPILGPTWSELREGAAGPAGRSEGAAGAAATPSVAAGEWWRERREELLAAASQGPVYVYDRESLTRAARALSALPAVDRLFYSLKANHHPGVLAALREAGCGFECVSLAELEHVLALFPAIDRAEILFTPNFAPRGEYARALELGVQITIDNLHPLACWPELFAGRDVFLRLDPGRGRGHHVHVRTAGTQSKFGLGPEQVEEARPLLEQHGIRVVGLHAHAGSGIRSAGAWLEVALALRAAAERFPEVQVLDVGGGLGVPERQGQPALDLAEVGRSLSRFQEANPRFALWLEPGRFLVAESGVLLARVTQVKRKGEATYVGVETGMNSLIRPALYGAYHPIVNLTRLDEPATEIVQVVGPICESGDILGRSRRLPAAEEGDVLLIGVAGAYGRVMSSSYNLRAPAAEVLLPPRAAPPR
jgi:diaminopimelate decarboxylase/aspartate kinase